MNNVRHTVIPSPFQFRENTYYICQHVPGVGAVLCGGEEGQQMKGGDEADLQRVPQTRV